MKNAAGKRGREASAPSGANGRGPPRWAVAHARIHRPYCTMDSASTITSTRRWAGGAERGTGRRFLQTGAFQLPAPAARPSPRSRFFADGHPSPRLKKAVDTVPPPKQKKTHRAARPPPCPPTRAARPTRAQSTRPGRPARARPGPGRRGWAGRPLWTRRTGGRADGRRRGRAAATGDLFFSPLPFESVEGMAPPVFLFLFFCAPAGEGARAVSRQRSPPSPRPPRRRPARVSGAARFFAAPTATAARALRGARGRFLSPCPPFDPAAPL